MAREKLTRFEDTTTLYNDLRARMTQLKGPKGDPFTYEDFTEQQLKDLTGPRGLQGETGPQGYSPVRGTDYWTAADINTINTYNEDYIDKLILPLADKLDAINGEVF